jgi:diguanylate cyclase (GGDEF)-like protein
MNELDPRAGAKESDTRAGDYYERLRVLQRREWWSWGFSLAVILLLTGAVSSLAFPAIFDERKEIGSSVSQSILGLVFLIALFGAYLTYEKVLINRLRLELAQGQFHSAFWRNLALLDPLTGLYNRRYAERRLKAEIARSERKGYPLILVLFDLNNFKQINDRFGHSAGDLVLQEFADRLSRAVRETDLAARLGGDEFMLLLTECDSSQLPSVLNRLQAIEVNLNGKWTPVEFSAGWKEYEAGQQAEQLMAEADKALYEDKQGRKIPVAPVLSL